ncbi:MAG TPA: FtsW/RodA/SpoVE family cell cycle protein, partial [Arachidicoccus soli]|nr:FtsW/RodA/SpoVE family cell cycle protein [Arachidicoccus soli]
MMRSRSNTQDWDWITILIVAVLLVLGIINLYSAAYNPNHPSLFSASALYGKQIIWIGLGVFIGLVISLIDSDYIRKLTPVAYFFILILLIIVLFTPSVNGARSWLGVGSFGIQPSEFAKLGTALMLAYIIGQHRGNLVTKNTLYFSLFILLLTMG